MEASFSHPGLAEVIGLLGNPDSRGVFVSGGPWTGKTALLHYLAAELKRQGRMAFVVKLWRVSEVDLAGLMLSEMKEFAADVIDGDRTIRASSGLRVGQGVAMLNRVAEGTQAPVLLFDGVDEALYPQRMAAAIEELTHTLDQWRFVVASRPVPGVELRRFFRFDVYELLPFMGPDMIAELRDSHLSEQGRAAPEAAEIPGDEIEGRVDDALSASRYPAMVSALIEELALARGLDRISALARKLRIPEDRVRGLLGDLPGLLAVDEHDGTVAIADASIQWFVLTRRLFQRPFRLTELSFGAEEAERDDLLDASFVGQHNLERILGQDRRSIVIGDRGSGKSAIFRKLAEEQPIETLPVDNTGDLLHCIVEKGAWLDADALRAAWLVVIAAVVASAIPDEAPRALRYDAADLRTVLKLPTKPPGWTQRAVRMLARLFGGATLKFGVGPVNFEAKLPTGARPRRSFLDAETILREMDLVLKQTSRRVVVVVDRIDETFKYDPRRQEAVVQALLQAEARVSQFDYIAFVVFLRTDLFELYDIQEKNKLVSRSLALEWSEEDWLRLLIRRVFANEPFARLARRLHVDGEDIEMRAALEVIFPAEIEDQPIDRWLIESLRNGNGDISPRLAVLLLHLTRERSPRQDELISAVPLFSADAVQRAMTKLSDLSFSEMVNDFKVAPTFVQSCRAGKLTSFTLSAVDDLFDGSEGKTSDQVRLLERLGFLERVVEQRGTQTKSLFRIPRLYTRCWDYA